jgi:hypothetical protein
MATATTSADQKQIAAPDDASQTSDKKAKETSRKESLSGAAARAAFGSLAFLFRLPIRLFRPVKVSVQRRQLAHSAAGVNRRSAHSTPHFLLCLSAIVMDCPREHSQA